MTEKKTESLVENKLVPTGTLEHGAIVVQPVAASGSFARPLPMGPSPAGATSNQGSKKD